VFAQLTNALWHIDAGLWGPSTPSNNEKCNANGRDDEDTKLKHDLVRMKLVGMGAGVIFGLGSLSTEDSWSLYFAYLSFAAACALNLIGYYLYI
tara:strand:- start:4631 stop:4912 length:282 start_codon:yes stop_codon:yes gene_type:complete